ncbi:sodium/proline symporter PutP [Streptantibioticus ferralitis]|uniref:Sodium/proline symporter n=1 Tax=Streptantibioticus ferralitis TaxID=236510 RepID=A0ABT5YSZ1_9ACTN|nr:sodium/proline symporter PutP [Streptantibioticus ferralitis]MDF2254726.1 sodium/proline symporter PutP [Streptantibioticus ferralitis]
MELQTAPVLITFGLFMFVMIGIGVHQETETFADFALGGRRLNPVVAALSAEASDMSGWLFLGLPGAVYAGGIGATWIAVGLAIGTYLNWRLVAPRLRTYTELANNAVTLSAYLEERFEDHGRTLRTISATVTVVFFTVYVASGFVAGGLLLNQIFDVGFGFGVTVFAVVMVTYSVLGGFRAVSASHLLQGTLMLLGAFAAPVIGVWRLGGPGALHRSLAHGSPALLDLGAQASFANGQWDAGKPLDATAVISMLAWGLGYFGQPHILARFMAIQNPRDIPKARRISAGWVVLALAGTSLAGLLGTVLIHQPLTDPETVFIALSTQLANPWLAGVLLVAVLAAIKSTADSQLLVTATSITEDFFHAYVHRRASDAALLWVARAGVIGVAAVAYLIALSGGAVLDIVSYAWAGFGAAFGPVLLLSLYWPRMTKAGATAGIVTGALTVLLWGQIDPLLGPFRTGVYAMVPGVVAATAAALCFGAFAGRPPQQRYWGDMGHSVAKHRRRDHA